MLVIGSAVLLCDSIRASFCNTVLSGRDVLLTELTVEGPRALISWLNYPKVFSERLALPDGPATWFP